MLLLLVVPGQLVFLYTISLLQGQEAPVSVAFTVCYLCAALIQVNRKHTHSHTHTKENHCNRREVFKIDAQGVRLETPLRIPSEFILIKLLLGLGLQTHFEKYIFLNFSSYLSIFLVILPPFSGILPFNDINGVFWVTRTMTTEITPPISSPKMLETEVIHLNSKSNLPRMTHNSQLNFASLVLNVASFLKVTRNVFLIVFVYFCFLQHFQ